MVLYSVYLTPEVEKLTMVQWYIFLLPNNGLKKHDRKNKELVTWK